jgi:hypothetical protein
LEFEGGGSGFAVEKGDRGNVGFTTLGNVEVIYVKGEAKNISV